MGGASSGMSRLAPLPQVGHQCKKAALWGPPFFMDGRGSRMRTDDLLSPRQVRYQAALYPGWGCDYSRPWVGSTNSPLEELQHFLELHPHLADDLRGHGRFLAGALAFQAQAGAADGVALLVQQAADLADHQHVVALVVAAVAAALDRLQRRELGLPVAQHVRLHVAQLADLADGEVALGRDRREFAVAARIQHSPAPARRPRPAPSASARGGR